MRKGRVVIHQKTGEAYADNKNSAYWEHQERHAKRTADGTLIESTLANPDSLEDTASNQLWGKGVPPELATEIIERFMDETGNFPILSKKENEVLRIYTATGDMNITTKETGLSRSTVRGYLARIRRKMLKLVQALDSE